MDFGAKNNIAKSLNARGCEVTIGTHIAKRDTRSQCHSIVFSNGPGDPKECTAIMGIKETAVEVNMIFAICLGHQLMALANGADTAR